MTKTNKTTKKTWRTIAIAIITISTIGLGGCNMRQSNQNNGTQDPTTHTPPRMERIRQEILAHMYEKYGVEFNVIAIDFSRTREYINMYPVGGCPEADNVRAVRMIVDGNVVETHDSYFGIIIREDAEAYVSAMLTDIDLPMNVFFESLVQHFDNIFDGTKTFADFQRIANESADISSRFNVAIIVSHDGDVEERQNVSEQIFDALTKGEFGGLALVMFLPSEGFEKNTRTNRSELSNEFRESTTIFNRRINPRGGN